MICGDRERWRNEVNAITGENTHTYTHHRTHPHTYTHTHQHTHTHSLTYTSVYLSRTTQGCRSYTARHTTDRKSTLHRSQMHIADKMNLHTTHTRTHTHTHTHTHTQTQHTHFPCLSLSFCVF